MSEDPSNEMRVAVPVLQTVNAPGVWTCGYCIEEITPSPKGRAALDITYLLGGVHGRCLQFEVVGGDGKGFVQLTMDQVKDLVSELQKWAK